MRQTLRDLSVGTAAVLAVLALIRPALSVTGVSYVFRPWTSVLLTVVIAAVWIRIVLARRVPEPFFTLVVAGVLHGVLIIVLRAITQVFSTAGEASSLSMVDAMGLIVMNLLWGAMLGLLATGILWLRPRAV